MRLQPPAEHLLGLSDREFDAIFTADKPNIFVFHGYPWLTFRRTGTRAGYRPKCAQAIRRRPH
jgi:xylulose-5-phosphate/fructose-6-phosphate phosphoketolase